MTRPPVAAFQRKKIRNVCEDSQLSSHGYGLFILVNWDTLIDLEFLE